MPVEKKSAENEHSELELTQRRYQNRCDGGWILQYFCPRISVLSVGILLGTGSHDFSLHLFLTCVLPSQSLWISVSSGPTVHPLASFISFFCSVYASAFLTSSASPWPSTDSEARPAGFGCFPSRALGGSSSPSLPALVCGQRAGVQGCRRGGPQMAWACVMWSSSARGCVDQPLLSIMTPKGVEDYPRL